MLSNCFISIHTWGPHIFQLERGELFTEGDVSETYRQYSVLEGQKWMEVSINEAVGGKNLENKTILTRQLWDLVSTSLSKTNSADAVFECLVNWPNAHWATKMRDTPYVSWCNFVTAGRRLCANQIFLTWSQLPKLDPQREEDLENSLWFSQSILELQQISPG